MSSACHLFGFDFDTLDPKCFGCKRHFLPHDWDFVALDLCEHCSKGFSSFRYSKMRFHRGPWNKEMAASHFILYKMSQVIGKRFGHKNRKMFLKDAFP